MRSLTTVAVAASIAGIVLACGEDWPPCYRGDHVGCTCESGQHGYQACTEAQNGYGACVCDGTIPGLDAGAPSDAPGDVTEAGVRGLFETCDHNEQCDSGLCHAFPSKGQLCSKTCAAATAAADCPAPSSGCNNQGLCKPP